MMWDDGNWGTGQWLAMTFMMIAFWALLIVVVYWLIRAVRIDRAAQPSSPERLLADRYARGEIDTDEYQARLAVLHGD